MPMTDPDNRQRIPLVFGRGLDRETGQMALQPGSIHDLRNVYTQEAKFVVRRGFERKLTLTRNGVEIDAVLAIQDLPQEGVQIVVGWDASERELLIYRIQNQLSDFELLEVWAELDEEVDDDDQPPQVITCEVGSKVFMAHNEARVGIRAPTYVYDPRAVDPIYALQANLSGPEEGSLGTATTEEDVKFRGVTEHLGLCWGWGYGTESEYRPELVRVSEPREPTTFLRDSYFIPKPVQEPTLHVVKARSTALVFKPSRIWQIIGTGLQDFGIIPYDPLYGLLGSRLVVPVNGDIFFWSQDGPRVASDQGPSIGLDLPLGLLGAEPSDLVAAVDADEAYATYIPRRRVVLFVFGNRGYALSLWNESDPRWSYWSIGPKTYSAGLIRTNQDLPCPTGHPEWLDPDLSNFDTRIRWNNVGQTGGEFYEIWLQYDYYAWELAASDLVSPETLQSRLVETEPGKTYQGAIRYRRGGCYADEYDSSDPSTWPAISRGSFISPLGNAIIADYQWSRVDAATEQVELDIEIAHIGEDVEIWRAEQEDADTAPSSGDYELIHYESGPTTDFSYQDQDIDGERYYAYRVRHVTTSLNGNFNIQPSVWTGPWPGPSVIDPPPDTAIASTGYTVVFTDGEGNELLEREVWDDWIRSGAAVGTFPEELAATLSSPDDSHGETGLWAAEDRPDDTPLTVGVRYKDTNFGVDDYSPFSLGQTGQGGAWGAVRPVDE